MMASAILFFVSLAAAHALADFPLQSAWMVGEKKRGLVLLQHGGTHTLVALALLLPVSGFRSC